MSGEESLQTVPRCDDTLEYFENEESEKIIENIGSSVKKRSGKQKKIRFKEPVDDASSIESEDDRESYLDEPLNSMELCITIPFVITEKPICLTPNKSTNKNGSAGKVSSSAVNIPLSIATSSNTMKVQVQKLATTNVKTISTTLSPFGSTKSKVGTKQASNSVSPHRPSTGPSYIVSPKSSLGTRKASASISPQQSKCTVPSHIISPRRSPKAKPAPTSESPKPANTEAETSGVSPKASTATKNSSQSNTGTSQDKLNKSATNSKTVVKRWRI